jgi:hypothetical protein
MPTVIAGDFNVAKKKAPRRGVKINRKKKITVAALAKQVAKLGKISYDKVVTGSTYADSDNLTANYNAYNVSRIYNNCTPIFGNVAADLAEVNKVMLTRKEIYVSIRQNNEPNLVRMTLFLVSLKDQGASTTLFDPATRQLVLTSAGGADIAAIGKPECAKLNPKSFTVHATKRFTMGYEGSAGPTSDTYSQRRFKFVIKPKQPLIQNPVGNIFANSSFGSPIDPSQNYFIIAINDNSVVDLEYPKIDVVVYDYWSIPS